MHEPQDRLEVICPEFYVVEISEIEIKCLHLSKSLRRGRGKIMPHSYFSPVIIRLDRADLLLVVIRSRQFSSHEICFIKNDELRCCVMNRSCSSSASLMNLVPS